MSEPRTIPIALTIAGSDSGGGAGIQADLKAFSALGVYGASVVTAITAQNTQAVTDVHEIPVSTIAAQIEAVFDDLDIQAVKIGMLSSVPIIETVAKGLRDKNVAVVLDPVMVAKSGDKLLRDDAIDALKAELLPLATVLTPNIPEAATLTGQADGLSEESLKQQGQQIVAMGAKAVLMKGGHAEGAQCTDLLIDATGINLSLTAERIATQNTHGTGCTLSASIAAQLAHGFALAPAVEAAHAYLHNAIRAADQLSVGSGHGPVHHFHQLWS